MVGGEVKMRVVIMGATGSGKSTFINTASGSKLAVSDSLESCTVNVETATFFLDKHTVMLIDTPGFDDTTRSDTEVLKSVTDFLADSYSQGDKLTGVIYVHRISDNKMGGPSKRNFKMLCDLCGEKNLRNVLLVTNMWSKVDPHVGEARERELANNNKFFKPAIEKGARMLRHDGSQERAHEILRHLAGLEPTTLLVQDEMVDQEKDLAHTTAGAELMRDLRERKDRYAKALETLCIGIEAATRTNDEETKEILQEEIDEAQGAMKRIQGELEQMVTEFATANLRLEAENRRYKRGFKMQKADAEESAKLYERERKARELAEARERQARAQLAAIIGSQEPERREQEFKMQKADAEDIAKLYERERKARELAEARERQVRAQLAAANEPQEREKREKENKDQEKEKQERERLERERVEREKREREKAERERQEQEREERRRREREKREREEREKREKEKEKSGCLIQ